MHRAIGESLLPATALGVVVEKVDRFQMACPLVFGGQRVINADEQRIPITHIGELQ
ncbi:MAG: hypothetical protein JSV68_08405 [Anaerolineaceae bacterium]|nr:MAG: hypothetical protein JSV68_08405 [Anaerolineaceae bacterium]